MLSTLSGFHGSLGRFRRRPTLRGALACSCLVGGPVKADRVTKAVPGLEFGSQEKVVEGQLPDTVRLKHPQATEVWIDCPPGAGGNPVINAKNALPPSGYFDLIGQVVSVAIKTHSTKPAKLQLTARSRRSLREMSLSTSKATVSGLSAAPTVGAAKPLCTSLSTRGLLWSAATPSPACGDGPEPYDKRGFGAPLVSPNERTSSVVCGGSANIVTFGANRELLIQLNSERVRFLIVGGVGVHFHAPEREYDDLDILIDPTLENAERCVQALRNLGLVAPPAEVLAIPNVQIPLKVCHHAEILTPDRGVDFKKEHENSVEALVNDQPVRVASREFLIRMKTGTGRKQDAIDLRLLASSG